MSFKIDLKLVRDIFTATFSQIYKSTMNIDDHADTKLVGLNFLLVHYFVRVVDVSV